MPTGIRGPASSTLPEELSFCSTKEGAPLQFLITVSCLAWKPQLSLASTLQASPLPAAL